MRVGMCMLMLVAGVVLQAVPAWAEATNRVTLTLELDDGSRLAGVPIVETIEVRTGYAALNLPLAQVASFAFGDDRETVTFALRNGDRITGFLNLAAFGLDVVFGRVEVPTGHVRRATVAVRRTAGAILSDTVKGLVLWYTFDGDKGDNVVDESGCGNDGVSRGPTLVPDTTGAGNMVRRFPGAPSSTGSPTDHIEIASESRLRFGPRPFSIAMWIRPDVLGPAYDRTLASKYGPIGAREWILMLKADGEMSFATGATVGSGDLTRKTRGAQLATGRWQHVAVVKDDTEVTFYVDGCKLSDDGTRVHETISTTTEPVRLGLYRGGDGTLRTGLYHMFAGLMDDVRIYDRSLTADEILAVFQR